MIKQKHKTFHLRNIPEEDWRKFKSISAKKGISLNENLLRLLKRSIGRFDV